MAEVSAKLLNYALEMSERSELDREFGHPDHYLRARRHVAHAQTGMEEPDRAFFDQLYRPRLVVSEGREGRPDILSPALLDRTRLYTEPYSHRVMCRHTVIGQIHKRIDRHYGAIRQLAGPGTIRETIGSDGDLLASVSKIDPGPAIGGVTPPVIGRLLAYYDRLRIAAGGRVPEIGQFTSADLQGLGGIVGYLHIGDTSAGNPGDWRLRHKALRIHLPVPLESAYEGIGRIRQIHYASAVMRDYGKAVETLQPLYTRLEVLIGRTHRAYYRVILPARFEAPGDRLVILALPDRALRLSQRIVS